MAATATKKTTKKVAKKKTVKKRVQKKPPTGKKNGRPSVMTPEVVQKLEMAFSIGATDIEACAHAGIARTTLFNYTQENPKFLNRIEELKEKLPLKAKSEMAKLVNDGDKGTVLWYLERKKRDEFGLRTEINHQSTDGSMSPKASKAELRAACLDIMAEATRVSQSS